MAEGQKVASLYASIGADTSKLKQGLQESSQALHKLGADAKSAGADYSSSMNKMEGETLSLKQEITSLSSAAIGLGTALGAAGAGGALLLTSSTKLAARVETLGVVTKVMGANVGKTEEQIRSLEQSIVKQGITLQASRQAIARMIQANIDLSKATDLARLAQDAAVISGENSSDAFDKLTYVIASGNILMARRMGLLVDFQGAYERAAKAAGVTTDALSEQEKVVIRTNEVLSKSVNIAGAYEAAMTTAGKKVTSLDRHIEESRRILGEAWLPVYADIIDTVTSSLKTWENLDEKQQTAISTALGYASAIAVAEGASFLAIGTIVKLSSAFKSLAAAMGIARAASLGLAVALPVAALTALGVGIARAEAEMKAQADALEQQANALDTSKMSYAEYKRTLTDAAKAANLMVDAQGNLYKQITAVDPLGQTYVTGQRLVKQNYILTESAYAAAQATDAITASEENYQIALQRGSQLLKEIAQLREQQAAAQAESLLPVGLQQPLEDEVKKFADNMEELRLKSLELRTEIQALEAQDILSPEQLQELEAARTALIENKIAVMDLAAAHDESTKKILIDLALQRLALADLTEAQRGMAMQMIYEIAQAWGVVGAETIKAAIVMDKAFSDLAHGNVQAAKQAILDLGNAAASIQGDYYLRFHIVVTGAGVTAKDFGVPEGMGLGGVTTRNQVNTQKAITAGISAAGLGGGGGGGGKITTPKISKPKKTAMEIIGEAASAASRLGDLAADKLQKDIIDPLKKQLEGIDKLIQPGHIDASAFEHINELEAKRADIVQKIAQEEAKIAAFKEAEQRFQLVEAQYNLLQLIKENKLDKKDILAGLKVGTADMGAILDAMTKAMQALVARAEKELGISSPSRKFAEIGRLSGVGFEKGWLDYMTSLQRTMDTSIQSIFPPAPKPSGYTPGTVPAVQGASIAGAAGEPARTIVIQSGGSLVNLPIKNINSLIDIEDLARRVFERANYRS